MIPTAALGFRTISDLKKQKTAVYHKTKTYTLPPNVRAAHLPHCSSTPILCRVSRTKKSPSQEKTQRCRVDPNVYGGMWIQKGTQLHAELTNEAVLLNFDPEV